MTIQITRPETEALIQQCLKSGEFHDVDELVAKALGRENPQPTNQRQHILAKACGKCSKA